MTSEPERGPAPAAALTDGAAARWAALPAEVRERVDAELGQERYARAFGLLREADSSIGIPLGRAIIEGRLPPAPPDPLADAEALTGRVAGVDGPVLAVEAVRSAEGVELTVTGADGRQVLTVVDAGTAARYLRPGEPADGRPPAEAAAEWLGRQAAAALGVPFRGVGGG
ncbi:hypothetical protein [Kitasatospora phosalacinea]|uniref:hypothetical protein n=1 Tax=Kitasatospora phosalacinea TaxID=2065 RepID=UPI00131E6264|nr:hypothetical protein [Kitasatospora phosalacinea]